MRSALRRCASQSLYIDLKPKGEDRVELRYFFDNPNQYQPRILEIAGIADLIQTAERDYYTILPEDFALIGQKLYRWLDGSDRWLENALSLFPGEDTILAIASLLRKAQIATSEKLAHLPWEVLHNESGFLLAQQNPVRVPVCWLPQKAAIPSQPIPNRALQVLFMASSPLGVKPVLEFELEEARILQATAKQPLALTVEESGCLSELANLIASYDKGYFDVLHLTGHANLKNGVPQFLLETETGLTQLAQAIVKL